MILRSITVEGWRCFAEAARVGPFSDGLNVIHGPNGVGKSSLMLALLRGLFDNHQVSGEAIKGLRPWGRQLNPKVTLEFEQDGVTYRLRKQFLGSPAAELSRQEDGRFVPLAEGRAADERARHILSAETPARGVTDQRHWGLAQILWATQGNPQIDELSTGSRATIHGALGAQITGPGAETLERQITDAYGEFFTPGGKLKSGASAPGVFGLRSQRELAQEKRGKLLERLDEFAAASRRIEDLRNQTEQARHGELALSERLKIAREEAQAYKEFVSLRTLHEHEALAARERYQNLQRRVTVIAATRQEWKAVEEQLRRFGEDLPAQARHVEQCRARAECARKVLEQIRARRGQVQSARQTALLADRFTDNMQTLGELDSLLGGIAATQREQEELREQRERIVAPDARALQQIKKTARSRDDARLQLDAAVITVRIVPEAEWEVEIVSAEQSGPGTLVPGTSYAIKGAPEVVFRIPGVASFTATGPTQGVDQLRRNWEDACAKLEEQTAGYGTRDLDRLEQLHAQAAELEAKICRADLTIRARLGDRRHDAIRGEQQRAANVVAEIVAKFPAWGPTPPDRSALAEEADEIERQFTADIDRAERENDLAQNELNLALRKQIGDEANLAAARGKIADIQMRLAAVCDDGLSDAERSAKLTEIALERDAAQGKLAEANAKLEALGDDPAKLVATFERQLAAIRQAVSDAAGQLNTEEGRLQQMTAEAPYSALAAVEEEIDRLDGEIARGELQINAVRLLYETLVERKREVLQAVLEPVRVRAARTLQRITGSRFSDICFDESLLAQGVTPRAGEAPVSLDQISGGEREQLHFAVRFALADIAFRDERQLVVLDDLFTYTDTTRLARITAILEEFADRFEIILLTCHPERYRGLPKAEFFDLERCGIST